MGREETMKGKVQERNRGRVDSSMTSPASETIDKWIRAYDGDPFVSAR